jgi:hypothetical protein
MNSLNVNQVNNHIILYLNDIITAYLLASEEKNLIFTRNFHLLLDFTFQLFNFYSPSGLDWKSTFSIVSYINNHIRVLSRVKIYIE